MLELGQVFGCARSSHFHQLGNHFGYSSREEFQLESHSFVCQIHPGWLSIPVANVIDSKHNTLRVIVLLNFYRFFINYLHIFT